MTYRIGFLYDTLLWHNIPLHNISWDSHLPQNIVTKIKEAHGFICIKMSKFNMKMSKPQVT